MVRNEARGGKAFAFPLLGIVALLAFYWIVTDWEKVPSLLSSALSAIH